MPAIVLNLNTKNYHDVLWNPENYPLTILKTSACGMTCAPQIVQVMFEQKKIGAYEGYPLSESYIKEIINKIADAKS